MAVGYEILVRVAASFFRKTVPVWILDVVSSLVRAPDAIARLTVAFRDLLRGELGLL